MIVIRECRGFDELQACVDLQIEVWGYSDGDVIPRRVFLVAQKIGGQVIGAFDTEIRERRSENREQRSENREQGTENREQGTENREQGTEKREQGTGNREQGTENREQRTEIRDEGPGARGQGSGNRDDGDAGSLIGFAFGLPGAKTGVKSRSGKPEPYLHSHMLAVREGYRNQKIGARLKLAQREDALRRGFLRMEWTFDPVEIKNAFLNVHKLGAIVRNYEENFYGVSSSRLQGGLQTDRLLAEWWLATPEVEAAVRGNRPSEPGRPGEDWVTSIKVPASIYEWKADEEQRHLAAKVQAENREQFQEAFARGLAVVSFARNDNGDGIYYLGRWDEPAEQTGVGTESLRIPSLQS